MAARHGARRPHPMLPSESIGIETSSDRSAEHIHLRLAAVEARLAELERASASAPPSTGSRTGPAGTEVLSLTGPVVVEPGMVVAEAVSLTGPVDVYGHVLGNAVGLAADVTVHPGGWVRWRRGSIGGRVAVAEGATVLGDKLAMGAEERAASSPLAVEGALTSMHGVIPDGSATGEALISGVRQLARRLAVLLGLAAAGVLVVGFLPRHVDGVVDRLTRRPFWHTFLGGFWGLLLRGALLLALTIIGLPISLLLLLAVAAGGLLGIVGVGTAIGMRFAGARTRGGGLRFLWVRRFWPHSGSFQVSALSCSCCSSCPLSVPGWRVHLAVTASRPRHDPATLSARRDAMSASLIRARTADGRCPGTLQTVPGTGRCNRGCSVGRDLPPTVGRKVLGVVGPRESIE